MSQENIFSDLIKSVDINITLSNFEGLHYDIDENAEYEVVATILNDNLKQDRFKEKFSELNYKILVAVENHDALFNLFSNPLLLTLLKYENGNSEAIGFCSIDLSLLCSTKIIELDWHRKFESSKLLRKIYFDVKISTSFPLLQVDYQNTLLFTFESIHHSYFENNSKLQIGLKVPHLNEIDKNVMFTINSQKNDMHNQRFKKWLSLYDIPGNASNSIYINEPYDYPMKCEEKCLSQLSNGKSCKFINAVFKSPIVTQDACYEFHDHIRKSNKLAIEIIINDNDHLFGLIDCEELLHVGRKIFRSVVQLYKFDVELFRKNVLYDSVLYTSKFDSSKNRKSSRKVGSITHESLDDIKALDEDGNQIFIIVELALEKPLNEEIFEENFACPKTILNVHHELLDECSIIELRNELLYNSKILLQKYKEDNIKEMIDNASNNGDLMAIQNSLLAKIETMKNKLSSSSDYDTILCHLTSNVINPKKPTESEEMKLILIQIYESIGLIDKSEDLFLKDIIEDKSSENRWVNYAIFNARHENFDKLALCIDKLLEIEPKSLIGNILKAHLFFKTKRLSECINILIYLKLIYGELQELNMMEYMTNQILGIVCTNKINSCSSTNEIIENIYKRIELSWTATHDEYLLSWQNTFIKCAIFYIKIGCYDIAEFCLGEYYRDHGINVNYLYLLSVIDSLRGNFKEALVHLKKISIDDIGNHQVNFLKIVTSIILNLLRVKNFKEAKETFNTYIRLESCNNFLILFLFGSHYNSTEEFVIAKEFLIQAAKIYQCQFVYHELGISFLNLEMLELAEKSFLCALEYDIDDNGAWAKLTRIYGLQERHDALKFCDYFNTQ